MADEEPALPDSAAVPAAKPGIGETLRANREFRRASIEYVAELLRIEPRFLVALEEERFDAIGPPVFVKGYVKHYCELLGIDSRPLLDELRERLQGEEPPLQARRSAERGRERSSLPVVGAAVLVVALAALAIWQLGGLEWEPGAPPGAEARAPDPETSSPTPEMQSEVAAVAGADETGVVVEEENAAMPAAGTGSGLPLLESNQEIDQIVEIETSGSVEEPAPSLAEQEIPGPVEQSESVPAADPAGEARLEIELRFVEDSWTEVTGEGGERLFYGLARAGAEERIRTNGDVRVLLGNAGGVVVRVNGEPFTYPAGSRSGDLARFRLSAENY